MPDGRFPGVINTPRADEKSAIETVSVLLKNAIHGLETMGHTSTGSSGRFHGIEAELRLRPGNAC
jgi:hypothetical protein